MPANGLDALDAKAEQSKRRHRMPPPPKRKPADPAPVPETSGDTATGILPAHLPKQPAPAAKPAVSPAPAAEPAPAPASSSTERRPWPTEVPGPLDPAAVASAVKVAQDSALAYSAAVRKERDRLEVWLARIAAARRAGAAPGALRASLDAAALRAGVPVEKIPAVVWRAAGLTPPG